MAALAVGFLVGLGFWLAAFVLALPCAWAFMRFLRWLDT